MSDRTRAIYDFIARQIRTMHRPPPLKEIAVHFDMKSTNAVRYHLTLLVREGMIERDRVVSRGIRLREA